MANNRIKNGKQTQSTIHFKINKTTNSNIIGNQAIDELSDVEYTDNVQQQMSTQQR